MLEWPTLAISFTTPSALPDPNAKPEWEDTSWIENSRDPDQARTEVSQVKEALCKIDELKDKLGDNSIIHFSNDVRDLNEQARLQFWQALQQVFPRTEGNISLYRHLELTGLFAEKISRSLGRLMHDIVAYKTAGNVHDIGRLTGIHRYHTHDLIGQAMLQRLNMPRSVTDHIPTPELNIGNIDSATLASHGEEECLVAANTYAEKLLSRITKEEIIILMSDFVGKPSKKSLASIITWPWAVAHHRATRGSAEDYAKYIREEALWPSEIYAHDHLHFFADGWLMIYRSIRNHWKHFKNVDLDLVRKEILSEEKSKIIE